MRFILSTLIVSALLVVTAYQKVQSTVKTGAENVATAVSPTPADDFQRISLEDAKKDYDAGNAFIVDARDKDSYKVEHIKGALNIPYADFDKRFKEFPKDRKIIVYCSCPNEHTSGLTVAKLNEKKIRNSYALTSGTKAWKEAGYPMESGE